MTTIKDEDEDRYYGIVIPFSESKDVVNTARDIADKLGYRSFIYEGKDIGKPFLNYVLLIPFTAKHLAEFAQKRIFTEFGFGSWIQDDKNEIYMD